MKLPFEMYGAFAYFSSSLILRVLRDAHSAGVKFSVVVVDGRPKFEGPALLLP